MVNNGSNVKNIIYNLYVERVIYSDWLNLLAKLNLIFIYVTENNKNFIALKTWTACNFTGCFNILEIVQEYKNEVWFYY